MRVSPAIEEGDIYAYVSTTEGTTERYVLRGIAEKFNGKKKLLYFPELPPPTSSVSQNYSVFGFIRQTLNYPVKWKNKKVKRYIILMDRDKWCSENEVKKEKCKDKKFGKKVNKHLQRINFSMKGHPKEMNYHLGLTYIICGNLGGHYIEIYLCISGENKDIDENLSYLYYLKFGEKVEPEWKIIKSKLKERNITLTNLIKQSSEKYLEKSLPHLLYPIKKIDIDC